MDTTRLCILGIAFSSALLACTAPAQPDGGNPDGDVTAADAVMDTGVQTDALIGVDGPTEDRPDGDRAQDVCPNETTSCAGSCVDLQSDSEHCGACDNSCPAPVANGVSSCRTGMCVMGCSPEFQAVGGQCIPAALRPRPLLPISLGTVSNRRPTLRWEILAPFDGALVELCRDRACTMVIETLRVQGTSVRLTAALPPRTVVYWRLRGMIGMNAAETFSPTWLFHTPTMDASAQRDLSVHGHLDVNGDGFDDLAMSARTASPGGRMYAGRVQVYHGNRFGVSMDPNSAFEGSSEYDLMGASLASAGDVNGDGFGDLLVGEIVAAAGARLNAGRVRIFFGSAVGLSAARSQVIEGGAAGDQFGRYVAGGGDVNADGYADVVIGAPVASPSGRFRAGTASVFYGNAMGVRAAPARVYEGVDPEGSLGQSVADAGDINGDGFSDIIASAPSATGAGQSRSGVVSIYFGSNIGLPAVADVQLTGTAASERFGVAVSAEDLNNDGLSEIIVGVAQAGGGSTGAIRVFEGMPGGVNRVPTVLATGGFNERFGDAVVGAGDLNGDGFGDVIVGSPGANRLGGASTFFGSMTGATPASERVLPRPAVTSGYGSIVAGVGDLNGDGLSDIAIGAPGGVGVGAASAGSVSLFFGTMLSFPAAADRLFVGGAQDDALGSAIALNSLGARPSQRFCTVDGRAYRESSCAVCGSLHSRC